MFRGQELTVVMENGWEIQVQVSGTAIHPNYTDVLIHAENSLREEIKSHYLESLANEQGTIVIECLTYGI